MTDTVGTRTAYEFDLGATLHRSRWLYERQFDGLRMVYAPDWHGMPVVLATPSQRLLDAFSGGSLVGTAIMAESSRYGTTFPQAINIVNALFERGFVREEPDGERFIPKGYQPSKKGMNIWLHINNHCNLACSYCFVEHTKEKMNDTAMLQTISRIGRTVRKHGVRDILVKFAGGEPTLALPEMEAFHAQLCRELADTGAFVHWTILTNGTKLTNRFLDFVKLANAAVSISIDGYGDYHDRYRVFRTSDRPARTALPLVGEAGSSPSPRGSWNIINRNIEKLQAEGIRPYINAMVGPKTSPGLADLARWIFGGGMIGTIHVVRNVDDSWAPGAERADQYARYCAQLERDFELMFRELEDSRYELQLPRWMEVAELSFESPAPDICCGMGSDHIVIRHDGTLASCPMTVHERAVVPDDDLIEAAAQTFTASPVNRPADDVCLGCQWYKVCASACPVANERIKGKPFTQSPLCRFWKYVIPRYLDFYGTKLLQAQRKEQPPLWNGVEPRIMTGRVLTQ